MATTVTAADVISFAPELESEGTTRIELMLEHSDNFLNEGRWGRKFKLAKILLTCHILTIGKRNGASGAVVSESLGDQSIAFSSPDSNEMLNLSHYGQQYLALRKTLGSSPLVL